MVATGPATGGTGSAVGSKEEEEEGGELTHLLGQQAVLLAIFITLMWRRRFIKSFSLNQRMIAATSCPITKTFKHCERVVIVSVLFDI
mgnify:CR=1 FL=1